MEKKENLTREQRLNDYNIVANFLMSGDTEEVEVLAKRLDWVNFIEDCCEFMTIEFIRKFKDYIDWEIYTIEAGSFSTEFAREFADYIDWEIIDDKFYFSDEIAAEFKEYLERK